MFVDEPGLQFLFSAMSGYGDVAARADMETFFAMVDRPRGVHLCGNPDWDFLLGLDLDILSLDVYSNGEVFANYAPSIRRFLDRGATLVWGIAPTNVEPFEKKVSHPWKLASKRSGRPWGVRGSTEIFSSLAVSFPPPPAVS